MSKVVNPLLSQDARGSVSGIQFSRNRSGCYGSRKSTSNHKTSDTVREHRSRLKLAHTTWQGLDPGLQADWQQYAGHVLTGRNAFVGAAIRCMLIGYPTPTLSPLEHFTHSRLRNLRFYDQPPPANYDWVNWSSDNSYDDRIIIYQAVPHGLATPHVRKFRYLANAGMHEAWKLIRPPYLCPWWALRIIHWEWKHGVTIAEYRGAFPTDADFWFYKDP